MRGFFLDLAMRYRDISYRKKLLLSYFVCVLLPLATLVGFSAASMNETAQRQSEQLMTLGLKQTAELLGARLNAAKQLTDAMLSDRRLREILEKDPSQVTISEQIDDYKYIESYIANAKTIYPEDGFRLFVPSELIYADQGVVTYNVEDAIADPAAPRLYDFSGKLRVSAEYELRKFAYPPGKYQTLPVLSVTRVLRSLSDMRRVIGILAIDIPRDSFLALLQTADFSGEGVVLIVSGEDVLLKYISPEFLYVDELADIGALLGDGRLIAKIQPVEAFGLTVVSAFPRLALSAGKRSSVIDLIWVAIAMTALVLLLAALLAKNHTVRIARLAIKMHKVEQGDTNVSCEVSCADEVGRLEASFNYLLDRIRAMLKEQYELGLNIKEQEMRVLQAQIKPHFLYNTLDLIYWTARDGDTQKCADIVSRMAGYYRMSLGRGAEEASLEEELLHVDNYVFIQNSRYGGLFTLAVCVPEDLLMERVPKFLLQPLVENAIQHGILETPARRGSIRINACAEGGRICIEVEDDGAGISPERLARLPEHSPDAEGGYGVKNIHKRLQLRYGLESGLRFASEEGKWTRVTIVIAKGQV